MILPFIISQPPLAREFALPRELSARGIRRYGFHGLSYEYIVAKLPEVAPGCANGKIIVAHLGNGASMCAINEGRSIATTMGFTPVDGLPMGTRTGTLDPGVILFLLGQEGMDANTIEHLIYERSGLLGVSGLSSDMRTLLASGAPASNEAIDLFIYRIVGSSAPLLPRSEVSMLWYSLAALARMLLKYARECARMQNGSE